MSVAGFGGAADGGGTGLASHAAQMGFARGAQMQQQQLHQAHDGRFTLEGKAGGVKTRIRDVWKHNLAQEMAVLRSLVEKYPYISMVSFWIVLNFVVYYLVVADVCRTRNSLVLLHARSERSQIKQTTTTKPYAVTSTY
jgi:hypothetical protein